MKRATSIDRRLQWRDKLRRLGAYYLYPENTAVPHVRIHCRCAGHEYEHIAELSRDCRYVRAREGFKAVRELGRD